MTLRIPLVAVLAFALAAPGVAQQPRPAPQLNVEQKTLLHCAATFAIVSGRQHAKDAQALAFPDITERGREYFIEAMAQLMDEAGLDHDAVKSLVAQEAAGLQDPAVLYKQMPACLASLQASGL
jgi:hypothetical protein